MGYRLWDGCLAVFAARGGMNRSAILGDILEPMVNRDDAGRTEPVPPLEEIQLPVWVASAEVGGAEFHGIQVEAGAAGGDAEEIA